MRTRVWERWKCAVCGCEKVRPGRTLKWAQKSGRADLCKNCGDRTHHQYIEDAPKVG